MVVVDGYIGSDPAFRTRARLIMEAANANVAGMQQWPACSSSFTARPATPRPRRLGTGYNGHLYPQPASAWLSR